MTFKAGTSELTPNTLVNMARHWKGELPVEESAWRHLNSFRKIVDEKAGSGETYYGINTGFGYLANVKIPSDQLIQLQQNIIRSHACGVGDPIQEEIARATLLLRLHTFLLGHTGIGQEVALQIKAFFDRRISPVIPEQGSVGACGDLAPLAHLALGLLGEGDVYYQGKRTPAAEVFEIEGLKPVKLSPKEGLSLINGTQFMTAISAFVLDTGRHLALAADVAASLSLDATRGTLRAFDPRIQKVRPHNGQAVVSSNINLLFDENDQIQLSHANCEKVQDPYSFRCTPQVHGASRDALAYVERVITTELNSVTDNPLVFGDGTIISGGNFHGQPVAMAMDFAAIAIAELASISEQRLMKLTNPQMSGLPAFLVKDSGLNSGYMIPHVVAASLVSENKILCHPASVDSIPTSADKEDHVSMGPIAARKAKAICLNTARVIAIEILGACQGIDLLAPLKPSQNLQKVYDKVREISPYMERDRSLHKDINEVADWIYGGGLTELLLNSGIDVEF